MGLHFKIKHCNNSAAICDYPYMSFDMVRAGIVLYGYPPSSELYHQFVLHPAMSLKSTVCFVKEVDKNEYIGYGRASKTKKRTRIATIPIGYADGFGRCNFDNGTRVLINGKRYPIIGKICMDQFMVDISEDENSIKVGDEVIIFGQDDKQNATVIASNNGTISYEVLCSVSDRVPRVYYRNDQIVEKYLHKMEPF